MKLVEVPMNIITVPQGWYTACAISKDMDLSVGLPKLFNDTYRFKAKIDNPELGHAYLCGNAFALVVKENSYNKADENEFDKALEDLATLCVIEGVSKLAIPKFCCGKNGFAWKNVKEKIKTVFEPVNITIMVCVKGE